MKRTSEGEWSRVLGAGLALALAVGCGGGQRGAVAEPAAAVDEDDDDGEGDDDGDELIPEEKYEEIARVFDRKTPLVSRCYVAGVESGEVDKAKKGAITVGVTVSKAGTASNVKIIKSSFGDSVDDCVKTLVEGWSFTDGMPRPLETSHTYVLDRF